MNETCDSCGKPEWKLNGGFYEYKCNVCKETFILCDTCSSVAMKEQKCIECLNDGK